jgi:N-acetylglutamate synthase-like GNAT family acetyltransferase
MSDEMSLRPAAIRDVPRLAELSGILGYPVAVEKLADRVARVIARDEHVLLVAERAGQVVGWIHAAQQELVESERRCEILGLVVDPEQRRSGAGRHLVAAVESWARRRGLAEVSVRSAITRAESHPFYERLGFVRVKTQHVYRKVVSARPKPFGSEWSPTEEE